MIVEPTCIRCGCVLQPGQAIQQTLVCGSRDLGSCVTLTPGGLGKLVECLKCPQCGYSITGARKS